MNMYQLQQFHIQPMMMKMDNTMRKRERSKAMEKERLHVMDLSGMSLEFLPKPSLDLATICKLDLSNNNLQEIPESLTARLLNVEVLDVRSNQLKSLPNSIGCLSKLKVLNVSGNFIESLPKTIENCRALEELNANFNKLSKLPDTIGFELVNLKKLSVNSNKLVFLPSSTSHLTALKVLDARLNCLRALPEDLENLINLETLNVSQNFQYLDTLPYSIGLLLSLIELDVSYNNIKTLPESIGCLKNLQKLSVEGNPLTCPPMEVVEQGLHVVMEYMHHKMNSSDQNKTKKRWWIGKIVKCGTFNKQMRGGKRPENEGYNMLKHQNINGLASPGLMGMLSPLGLLQPPVAVIILDSLVADMCIRDMKLDYHHPDEFESIACNLAQVPQMRLRDGMKNHVTQLGLYNFPRRLSNSVKGSITNLVGKFYGQDENFVTAYGVL